MSGQDPNIRRDKLELLILSEAGKPVYSFSKREDSVTLMPLCSTLINYAKKAQKETLMSIKTSDNLLISFITRSPLIFIVIHQANYYIEPLILVDQLEAQIISILTAKALRSVFEERPTFDLKRLLYGSEKLIDSIANLSTSAVKFDWPMIQAFLAVTLSNTSNATNSNQPNILSGSASLIPTKPHRLLIPIVTIPASIRDNIHGIMSTVIPQKSKNMVFSLLFKIIPADGEEDLCEDLTSQNDTNREERINEVSFKLITVCNHHSKHKLTVADIHLILALLDGSRSQLSTVESLWMPVCLPRFNQDAFLHSYISYINNMQCCLIMLSVDRDEFSNCQSACNTVEEKMNSLLADTNLQNKLHYRMSPLVHPSLLELHDKLISNSLTGSALAEAQQQVQIYNSKLELYHARQLQFLWYQTSKQVLWWQRSARKPLSPVLYYVTKKMLNSSLKTLWLKLSNNSVFLGWHVPTFQLYAQFDNTITTTEAIEVIHRITSWIKKEEENFSIKDYR